EQSGAGSAALARAYVLSGVLQVDGLENKDAGVKMFVKALKIAPDIQIPPGMGTTPGKMAFKQARAQTSGPPPESTPAEPAKEAKGERAPPPREAKEGKEAKEKDEELSPEAELEKSKPAPPPAEGKRSGGDSQREKQLREEKQNLAQDLAMSRKAESKER